VQYINLYIDNLSFSAIFWVLFASISIRIDYKYTSYWIENSTTKAIAFVEKIDNMLQRQIVIKALGKQINIEDLVCTKYAISNFHSKAWVFISANVTIYRTIALPESYENNHCITTTKLLRRRI
jgi:hypothetical protein